MATPPKIPLPVSEPIAGATPAPTAPTAPVGVAATTTTAATTVTTPVTALSPTSPNVPGTTSPTVEVTVPNTSGTVTFQLIVTDNLGQSSPAATATVTIQAGPAAKLTATPAVAKPGETITLSSAGSTAAAPGTLTGFQFSLKPAS